MAIAGALVALISAAIVPPVARAADEDVHSLTLLVDTEVLGDPSPGTVVQIECTPAGSVLPDSVRLGFDAEGRATVAAGDTDGWQIVPAQSQWLFHATEFPSERTTCTFEEIETGGAASIAWTCKDGQIGGAFPGPPCLELAGEGPGPITVRIGDVADDISTQGATVLFTNTFVNEPVVVAPVFTG